MTAVIFLSVLLVGLTPSQSSALEGVPYISLHIDGHDYSVPIPNSRAEEDFYMLKKATLGDDIAREILLGGHDDRWFFIGDAVNGVNICRWCHITKTDMKVIEYK